jgi:hypothetical protein
MKNKRRMLPYLVEFVKFSTGFMAIVAAGLLVLHTISVIAS